MSPSPWTKEGRRIYNRVYAKCLHDGLDNKIACIRALRAMRGDNSYWPRLRRTAEEIALQESEKGRSHGFGERSLHLTPDQLAEHARIRDLEHPTRTAAVFGDPLPGRSALDQMSAEERARLL